MDDTLGLTDVRARCEQLRYPLMRADAAVALEGVTVEAGGRERNLGVVVSELDADSFADPEELYDDLVAALDDAGAGGA